MLQEGWGTLQTLTQRFRYCAGAIALLLGFPAGPLASATSAPPTQQPGFIRSRAVCPIELEPLTQALLRDLPSYLNRQRHQRAGGQAYEYAIVANQPNFQPLPVITSTPDPKAGGLYQVFFTLLEHRYDTQQRTQLQTYHWLFLAHTQEAGWNLALLYSRSGPYPATQQVPSPLRDTTQEATGRAIRLWLRDCAAGAIQPAKASPP